MWLHYANAPPHFRRQVTISNTAADVVGLVLEETWLDSLFTESHFRWLFFHWVDGVWLSGETASVHSRCCSRVGQWTMRKQQLGCKIDVTVHIHCSMSFGIADNVSPCVANTATNKAFFFNQRFCVLLLKFHWYIYNGRGSDPLWCNVVHSK
jgi:hypothetical protein